MGKWIQIVLPFMLLTASVPTANGSGSTKTELLIVSSLHTAHIGHPTFDYDVLFSLVREFEPEYVGVEIRPEDIGMSRDYLSSNYPREMIGLAFQYQENAFWIDWLGHEIAGTFIPESYWKDLRVTKLSVELVKDEAVMARKPNQIALMEQEQSQIIETATPSSLADGRYGALCRQIDELERDWLTGSIYEEIFAFNQRRDEEIARNLLRFLDSHRGSRIIVVLGADHRTFAVEAVVERFAETIELVDVPEIHD